MTEKDSRGAVLVIGSLLWDDAEPRPWWRQSHLDLHAAEKVRVPIHYGRSSDKGTKRTMTIALRENAEQFSDGAAWLVPLRRRPLNLDCEARALWNAESRGAQDRIGKTWGTVGLLCRESSPRRNDLEKQWGTIVNGQGFRFPERRDRTPLTERGTLDMEWPVLVDDEGEPDYDAILVAVTVSNVDDLTADGIADVLRENPGAREYFDRCRRALITTAQDGDILAAIRHPPSFRKIPESFQQTTDGNRSNG